MAKKPRDYQVVKFSKMRRAIVDLALRGRPKPIIHVLYEVDVTANDDALTAASLRQPDEIYGFFRDTGVPYVGFNVEEIEGPHRFSSLEATTP